MMTRARGCRSRRSMIVAGRNIDVSVCIPARPGRRSSSASSTPSVTSRRVGAGELLDDQHEAVAVRRPPRRRSAAGGPRPIVGHVGEPQRAGRALDRHLAQLGRVGDLSSRCRTCSRCCGVSMKPPVPGVDASRKRQRRHDLRVARRSLTTWFERDARGRAARSGSTWTCSCWSRMAPDRHVGHAGHAHQPGPHRPAGDAPTARSATAGRSDRPIIRTRLDEDSGCSSVGGLETFGSACACVSRSCDELAGPVDVGARLEDHARSRTARAPTPTGSRRRPRPRSAGPPRAGR